MEPFALHAGTEEGIISILGKCAHTNGHGKITHGYHRRTNRNKQLMAHLDRKTAQDSDQADQPPHMGGDPNDLHMINGHQDQSEGVRTPWEQVLGNPASHDQSGGYLLSYR